MTFTELKKWCKNRGLGFYAVEKLKYNHPDVLEAFETELKKNTGRVGCYVYHSHSIVNDEVVFDGMRIGYYIRSKNPFSWTSKRVYGNH